MQYEPLHYLYIFYFTIFDLPQIQKNEINLLYLKFEFMLQNYFETLDTISHAQLLVQEKPSNFA